MWHYTKLYGPSRIPGRECLPAALVKRVKAIVCLGGAWHFGGDAPSYRANTADEGPDKEDHVEPTILRRPEVEHLTRLSKATLYRLIKSGTFPRPIRLAPRAVGWLRQEIDEWVTGRERAGSELHSSDANQ